MAPGINRLAALLALCAPLGCVESCWRGWYIDEDGCAVGKVEIHSLEEFDEVRDIVCFKGTLRFTDFPPQHFTKDLLAHIETIGDFAVNVSEENEVHLPSANASGVIDLSGVTKLESMGVFTHGVVRLSVPLVTSMRVIWLSENADMQVAEFSELVEITDDLGVSKNPQMVLRMPKLKRVTTAPPHVLNGFKIGGDGPAEVSFPELERIEGGMDVFINGALYVDASGAERFTGGVLDLPKLSTVTGWIDLGGWYQRINLPELKRHMNHMEISVQLEEGGEGLDGMGLEEVGSIMWYGSILPDGTNTLPHLKSAGSIWMKTWDYMSRLYLPSLERLGSLLLDKCYTLSVVDFPRLQCIGSIETICDGHAICLLPEELDNEIALSRTGGCEPTVDICDPRENVYHPYDEQWCLEQLQ